jgi:hypothetical protein
MGSLTHVNNFLVNIPSLTVTVTVVGIFFVGWRFWQKGPNNECDGICVTIAPFLLYPPLMERAKKVQM